MKTKKTGQVERITALSVMAALAVVFSITESFLAPLIPIPGARLGLSNIVTMFVFFVMGFGPGVVILIIKSAVVFLSRGMVAFVLSMGGGISAILVIAFFYYISRKKISVLLLSVLGAITHNMIQLVLVRFLYHMNLLVYFAPILVASGIVAGIINAYLLRLVMPLLSRIWRGNE